MKKYLILFVSFTLIVLISVGTSNAFFSTQTNSSGLITLGELDFSIVESAPTNTTIMPGDNMDLGMTIINSRNEEGTDTSGLSNFYLRFSITSNAGDDLSFEPVISYNEEEFVKINDTYYYLNSLNNGEDVVIFSNVEIPEELSNEFQSQLTNFSVLIEAIQANLDAVNQFWPELFELLD